MQSFTHFQQNFAVAESLFQLYQLFNGLERTTLSEDLHLALCSHLGFAENTEFQHAKNDRLLICARAANPIPPGLTMAGGLDSLLRQTIIVACTALESFFWDSLRESVLTIVKVRKRGADSSLKEITLTLDEYMSIQQWDDPDLRLKQIILNKYRRGTLYSVESIDEIVKIMTIRNFWEKVESKTGEPGKAFKRNIASLIKRRNQIAHRADRPEEGEGTDGHGLRPIALAWATQHAQAAKTLVVAANEIMDEAIGLLESELKAQEEQAEAQKAVLHLTEQIKESA